jgi:biopolymer transport protein ExbB/TolQ
MQWVLDNSGWLIGAVAVVHVLAFGWLWVNRNKQMRRLEAHLRNVVGGFATHTDVDPYTTIDERIDSFIADIREVIRDPARRDDQRRLYHRLVTKEESKKYLQGKTFETWYNVLQTFIETYPFWGILGTLLAIGLGFTAAGAGPGAVDTTTAAIVRNFGGAIWSTVAGLVCAIVLMLLNSAMEPSLRRLVEHRASVRDVIRAAKHELGVTLAPTPPAKAGTAAGTIA